MSLVAHVVQVSCAVSLEFVYLGGQLLLAILRMDVFSGEVDVPDFCARCIEALVSALNFKIEMSHKAAEGLRIKAYPEERYSSSFHITLPGKGTKKLLLIHSVHGSLNYQCLCDSVHF